MIADDNKNNNANNNNEEEEKKDGGQIRALSFQGMLPIGKGA